MNSRCRRFDVLLFAVLTQSVAAMIAVVGAHVVACDRSTVAGLTPLFGQWLAFHSTDNIARDSILAIIFGCFSRIKQ